MGKDSAFGDTGDSRSLTPVANGATGFGMTAGREQKQISHTAQMRRGLPKAAGLE